MPAGITAECKAWADRSAGMLPVQQLETQTLPDVKRLAQVKS